MGVRDIAGRTVRRIGYWLHRRRQEAELAEEMASHRAAAIAASIFPACQATRVDPLVALRSE